MSGPTRRARLERAVFLMRGSPQRELSSIAAEAGFATPSDFSRVFGAHHGPTPSSWDRSSRLDEVSDFGPVVTTTDWQGVQFSQWFWLTGGKISRIQVVYDPRPFFEGG